MYRLIRPAISSKRNVVKGRRYRTHALSLFRAHFRPTMKRSIPFVLLHVDTSHRSEGAIWQKGRGRRGVGRSGEVRLASACQAREDFRSCSCCLSLCELSFLLHQALTMLSRSWTPSTILSGM